MITVSGAVLSAAVVMTLSGSNATTLQPHALQSQGTIVAEQLRSLQPPTGVASAETERWDDLLRRMRQAPRLALPALADALNGSDAEIRRNAGWALMLLARGETAQNRRSAARLDLHPILTKLAQALESSDAQTRATAASALGTIGPRAASAVPALIKLLEDPDDKEFGVRWSAALALGEIGPAAKAALPSLLRMHGQPKILLVFAAQDAIVKIGGLALVPTSPAPGGIRLLQGWSHIREQGIDTQVGRIWRPDGLEIGYDIGFLAGQDASDRDRPFQWTKTQIVNERVVHVTMRPNRTLEITFEEDSANFSASPVRTEQDLAEVLLMVMTYTPVHDWGYSGIYSDLHRTEKSGDLGMEVTLSYAGTGYHAVVHIFGKEGPEIPVVVPVVLSRDTIGFTVETKEGPRQFSGQLTREGLVGTFADRQVKLRRGRSYWQ